MRSSLPKCSTSNKAAPAAATSLRDQLPGLVVLVLFLLGLTLAAAYLVKSMIGIDLFEDHFILHGLFFG